MSFGTTRRSAIALIAAVTFASVIVLPDVSAARSMQNGWILERDRTAIFAAVAVVGVILIIAKAVGDSGDSQDDDTPGQADSRHSVSRRSVACPRLPESSGEDVPHPESVRTTSEDPTQSGVVDVRPFLAVRETGVAAGIVINL
jgi:hypothetical protein